MHEASLHTLNCFITLTYSDVFLPPGGTLVRSDFQKFMKRLRKRYSDVRIRFYQCGEYGEVNGRPHFHALLFGFDFPDKYPWSDRKGYPVWRSASLEALWPFGQSEVGSCTFESAAYVARYITKKVTGAGAADYYRSVDSDSGEIFDRIPEYTTMSRRPGIGRVWIDRFMDDVYPSDEVIVRGKRCKPPRYYDVQFEALRPDSAEAVFAKRNAERCREDETPERLLVREVCANARVSHFSREVK